MLRRCLFAFHLFAREGARVLVLAAASLAAKEEKEEIMQRHFNGITLMHTQRGHK